MSLASRLAAATGTYFGTGDGVESGPFVSRIVVGLLPNGGVSIEYEATSREQGIQHVEHSLLTPGPDGRDQLFSAHSESPFVTAMIETAPGSGRFEPTDLVGPYAMAVVIDIPKADQITCAWWWANAGETLIEQSCATATRTPQGVPPT